jgi:copper transport protein
VTPAARDAGSTAEPPANATGEVDAAEPVAPTSRRDLGELVANLSRWVVYASLFLCVGGLTYLAWVHRGSEREARRLVFYVRRAAVVVVVASVVEWLAQLVASSSGDVWAMLSVSAWRELSGSGFAKGSLLRLVGGLLVLACLRIDHADAFWTSDLEPDHPGGPLGTVGRVSGTATLDAPLSRLRVEASPLAFVGAAALVVSEAFIGHTATVGPRVVVVVADAVHLLAGAGWVAGGLMLALTLWNRHRRGELLDAHLLATRFSRLASWALALVTATGVALAWSILRTPSALWATGFGRVLLVKLVLVAVAVGVGAHNHRTLVPILSEGDDAAAHRFRRALSAEVVLFAAVLFFTALLVVADPT